MTRVGILPKWGSCLLAWSAVILIPVAILVGIGLPWHQRMTELESETESVIDQIMRYERLIATIPRLKAELDRERNNQEIKAFYFDAPTAALAGAQLQSTIQEMVQAAGARLINTQFLPAEPNELPPRVRIRTQIQGDTNAMLDVLYSIEHARPFLFVDQLSVRSTTRRERRVRRQGANDLPAETNQELTIRLDVFGYALGSAS
ncbi:MAG: type II secretion system protein GspM [Chromatiaceae bacterium]